MKMDFSYHKKETNQPDRIAMINHRFDEIKKMVAKLTMANEIQYGTFKNIEEARNLCFQNINIEKWNS